VIALIRHLPSDAATTRNDVAWSRHDESMALLLELTHMNFRVLRALAGAAKPIEPLRVRRPWDAAPIADAQPPQPQPAPVTSWARIGAIMRGDG
jgi:hypothetical protein